MVSIFGDKSFIVGGYIIHTPHAIRQYYEFSDTFVTRLEDEVGNGYLYAYAYYNENYKLKWKFQFDQVAGIEPEIPELKSAKAFISNEAYQEYLNEFSGKELLIVYAGN